MSDKDSKGELKPCPCCGGEAELYITGGRQITINCKGCGIKRVQKVLRLSLNWLEKEMVKHWNTRPSTPKKEWISVKDLELVRCFAVRARQVLMSIPMKNPHEEKIAPSCVDLEDMLEICDKYLPSPPTDQTEKECKNPDCLNGIIYGGSSQHPDIFCPDCQKDQTEKECKNPDLEDTVRLAMLRTKSPVNLDNLLVEIVEAVIKDFPDCQKDQPKPPRILDIAEMPSYNSKVKNGVWSVTELKVFWTDKNKVTCAEHGACLCVSADRKIWRCATCNEGAYLPNPPTNKDQTNQLKPKGGE